ncbi:SLAP domain-containing protein, partial [Lactobacillus panisapium]|uniref:SLAP domain-containing protein n=1 Tax=Lactobacillus panisapium TaxID=2012495 RepID=UPI0022E3D73F
MNKNNSYKKVIVSLSGAALLTVGLGQMPNNVLNNMPVEVSAAKKTKVIGANSAIYRLKGKKMVKTGTVLKVGKKVSVSSKKTVKGKVYYKIGKNQYVKAVNVDGKNRNAAKKTVLYTRKGKVIKSSKIAKGQKVTIYGAAVTIKGKKYYSTKLGYIKASALAKKEPAIDNNDVEKPNENNTTPTDKPDSGNNTASTNNSNSTSVPSTGGSSSTSPSVPTVDPVQTAKDAAVGKIKAAATAAKAQIAGNKNLTEDQQKTANDAIDKAVTDAIGQDEKSGAVNAA